MPNPNFNFTVTDEQGVKYTPWTNGRSVGFEYTNERGTRGRVYFKPSRVTVGGQSNVFIVQNSGDSANDVPITWVATDSVKEGSD